MILAVFAPLLIGAKAVFFGDLQVDRGVRLVLKGRDPSVLLTSTQSIRDEADFALVNLESPLCDSTLPAIPKRYSLRSDGSLAKTLAKAKFTHAILANNHSLDRGVAGLAQTLRALHEAQISPVGASLSGDPCKPALLTKGADTIAVLALVVLPGIDSRHLCADASRVEAHLRTLRSRQIPSIVSLHWGSEFSPGVDSQQIRLARTLVASGASALVGHHAHVVQQEVGVSPSIVEGIPVWYGLGNFIFDQWQPWTARAQVAQVTLDAGLWKWRTIELVRKGPWVKMVDSR